MMGSSIFSMSLGFGKFRGAIDFNDIAADAGDAVTHAGSGGDQVQPELALQAFLNDFQVQQAEKAATKAKAERHGIFRLVEESCIVQLQLAERVAQRLVLVGEHGKNSGKHHRLDGFETGKRGSGTRGFGDSVAHARIGHPLDVGDDEADIAGFEFFEGDRFWRERAELFHFVDFVGGHQPDLHVFGDAAFHDAHEDHRAAVDVEPGIKHQRLKRILRAALRRGDAVDDGFQDIFHAEAAFCADQESIGGGNRQHIFDLLFCKIGLGRGQVNFVDDRDDGEVVRSGEESVGDGLCFDTLACVDDEKGALASGKRAGNFVGKVDVAGSIDQVEAIVVAVFRGVMQANAFRLDGDAALALQVHGIEHLLVHLALGKRAGHFQKAVGQGGFAVVDMRDDAKISYELRVHSGPIPPGFS